MGACPQRGCVPACMRHSHATLGSWLLMLLAACRAMLCCVVLCCAVVPRDSAWFSFWDGEEMVSLFDQDIFKQDW